MYGMVDTRDARIGRFRELLEEFCAFARTEGLSVTPYQGDGPRYFLEMPEPLQEQTLKYFQAYVEVCREVRDQDQASLRNDQLFLWRMFQKLRLHPPSNFMSEVRDGEVIEIHNHEFVQVYRNLNFFSLCSYTLDDLLCRPFWQLFQRDESVTNGLVEVGKNVFSSAAPGTQHLHLGEHTVLEIDSPGRFLSVIQHRVVAPLSDAQGRVSAAVSLVRSISCVRTANGEKY